MSEFLINFIESTLIDANTGKYLKGRVRDAFLKTHYPDFYKKLLDNTSFLKPDEKLLVRLWCIRGELNDYPKCSCGNYLKWQNGKKAYLQFCSTKCSYNVQHVQEVKKTKCLTKYGVAHHWLVPELAKKKIEGINKVKGETRQKINKTNMERYGGIAPACSKEVTEKIKRTNLKKYGKECTLSLPSSRQKHKEVWKKDFENIRSKIKKSWGAKTSKELSLINKKREETFLQRYGEVNISKVEKYRKIASVNAKKNAKSSYQKYLITCRSRYSRDSHQQVNQNPKLITFRSNIKKYKKWLEIQHYKLKKSQFEIANLLNIDSAIINKDFKKFNLKVMVFQSSYAEKEISKYITSLGVTVENRNRSFLDGIELDVFIPSKNIAIEFNGIYWHSYDEVPATREKLKHYYKTKLCNQNNIQLFHILETQWKDKIKKEIWKSILKGNLIGHSNKIYARSTEIKLIQPNVARNFYINNHLFGFCAATFHFGLFYNNELKAAMSFKQKDQNSWELVRFASQINTQIVGGASKLFKFFIKIHDPLNVITFADLMYSNGGIYKILGFNQVGKVATRFYYTDKHKLINRRLFQKKRLPLLLGKKYNHAKTEIENVLENTNYRIIYDSGKLKFKWSKTVI